MQVFCNEMWFSKTIITQQTSPICPSSQECRHWYLQVIRLNFLVQTPIYLNRLLCCRLYLNSVRWGRSSPTWRHDQPSCSANRHSSGRAAHSLHQRSTPGCCSLSRLRISRACTYKLSNWKAWLDQDFLSLLSLVTRVVLVHLRGSTTEVINE